MKFFRDLFFRKPPDYFRKVKFRKTHALVLPLQSRSLQSTVATSQNWRIQQVEQIGGVYEDHLLLPKKNRVQQLGDLPSNGRMRKRVELEKVQLVFHCQSLDPRSPIQHFIISLHANTIATLMVIPKEGNRLKLCQALCGTKELPDLEKLNQPELVNGFAFNFAANAGADPRARASLAIRCDNPADIARLESFISAIDISAPFDQGMLDLVKQIIVHSQNQIKIAENIDALEDERHELAAPITVFSDFTNNVKARVDVIDNELKELKEKCRWSIMGGFTQVKQLDLFSGFPNGIPDLQKEMHILAHYPDAILTFNNTIPEIHLAILANDSALLSTILKRQPMEIYTRDPHGLLPIQLARLTCQPELGGVIYATWAALPKPQQWATRLFIREANILSGLEFRYSYSLDPDTVIAGVQDYFSAELPTIEHPLAFYHAVQQNDQQKIVQLTQQEIIPWERLLNLCLAGDFRGAKKTFATTLLSEKYALFSAILCSDRGSLIAALQDTIPDTSTINHSVYFGHPERIMDVGEKVIFHSDNELQQIMELSTAIAKLNKKMERLVAQISLLAEPLASDQAEFRQKFDELWALEAKRKSLMAHCKVWREFSDQDWKLIINLHNPVIKFLEALKKKMCKRITEAGYRVCENLLRSELTAFKEADLIPHYKLLLAFLDGDTKHATAYIEEHLRKKQRAFASLPTKDNFYHNNIPRNTFHQAVLHGQSLPFSDFVSEKEVFEQFKKALYDLYMQEAQQLAALNQEAKMAGKILVIRERKGPPTSIVMQDSLQWYTNQIVIFAESISSLKNQFTTDNVCLLNDSQTKQLYYGLCDRIIATKSNTLAKLPALIEQYREHSKCTDPDIFTVFTLLLAQHQATLAYKAVLKPTNDYCVDDLLLAQAKKLAMTKHGVARASLLTLTESCRGYLYSERIMGSLIRCNLLSYEQQDPWGYTPLLLAVVANREDIVREFFNNKLASDWIVSFDHRHVLYYTLLSHANTRSMLKLVLHYYTNPNSRFTFLKGLERNLGVLLFYNHDQIHPLDTHRLELLDFIAAGHPIDPEDLAELLKHRKSFVQDGPYDPSMPKEIQQAFTAFNAKRAAMLDRSKVKMAPLNSQNSVIQLSLENEHYLSRFKTTAQLSANDLATLPTLFTECFELLDTHESEQKTKEFFENNVLSNTRYIYELFYPEGCSSPVAFLCFQLKALNHYEYGVFLCAHLSIAACAPNYAQKGLLSSSMKVVLALKRYADENNMTLKCYSRFVWPGVAYGLMPEHMDMSTKYHRKEGFVHFVAKQFNNKIEPNGASFPPVRSKAIVNRSNARVDAYRFFLNECLAADATAALPLVIDIDETFVNELKEDLQVSADMTQAHLDLIHTQLNQLLDSMQFSLQTDPITTGVPHARL